MLRPLDRSARKASPQWSGCTQNPKNTARVCFSQPWIRFVFMGIILWAIFTDYHVILDFSWHAHKRVIRHGLANNWYVILYFQLVLLYCDFPSSFLSHQAKWESDKCHVINIEKITDRLNSINIDISFEHFLYRIPFNKLIWTVQMSAGELDLRLQW